MRVDISRSEPGILFSSANISPNWRSGRGVALVLEPERVLIEAAENLIRKSASDWRLAKIQNCDGLVYKKSYAEAISKAILSLGQKKIHWSLATSSRVFLEMNRPQRVLYFLQVLREYEKKEKDEKFIVFTRDFELVWSICEALNIKKPIFSYYGKASCYKKIRKWLALIYSATFFLLMSVLNVFLRKPNLTEKSTIVSTIFRSPPASYANYNDYYFSNMHLEKADKSLYFWGLPYNWSLRQKISNRISSPEHFFTENHFVRAKDVFLGFFLSWKVRRLLRKKHIWDDRPCRIDGVDVTTLIKKFMESDACSANMLNLIIYYNCSKRLAKLCRPQKLILPFELRPLEKQIILGFKSGFASCEAVGYLHAPITERHTSFWFVEGHPLPDRILVMGDYARKELFSLGFPSEIISVAGVIKQSAFLLSPPLKGFSNVPLKKILVLLGAEIHQSQYLMLAIRDAVLNGTDLSRYEWKFRMHPAYRTAKHFSCSINPKIDYKVSSTETLYEDLSWSDIVINNGTGAALEALSKGKPVFYVRCGPGLNDDVLANCPEMAIAVSDFHEFDVIVRKFDTINPISISDRGIAFLNSMLPYSDSRVVAQAILDGAKNEA
jgi:hypothetical protein